MPSSRAAWIVFIILLAGFAVGVVQIFELRTDQGDVFPPYSTYRADPLGTRALYESFEQLKQFRVSRNFLPMEKLREPQGTLFILGLSPLPFLLSPKETLAHFPAWAAHGNRIVIS